MQKVIKDIVRLDEIRTLIPHAHPFLLIDRLEKVEAPFKGVGIKNVTYTENYFQGHFPSHPVMPGVLIIEAAAQTAASLVSIHMRNENSKRNPEDAIVYFMSIDEAKFRKPVFPGDQLRIEVELIRQRLGMWKYQAQALVENDVVATSVFSAKVM